MRDIFEYKDNFGKYSEVKSELKFGDLEMCPNPIISVVMPVYKRPHYFRQALKSVLNQDFTGEYEIVVVDNNTEEGEVNENQRIVEDAKSDNILYFCEDRSLGLCRNRTNGIELGRR